MEKLFEGLDQAQVTAALAACNDRATQTVMTPSRVRVSLRTRLRFRTSLASITTAWICEQPKCGNERDLRLTLGDDEDDALDDDIELEEQSVELNVERENGGQVEDDVEEDLQVERDGDDDLGNDLGDELDLDRGAKINDDADFDDSLQSELDEECDAVEVARDVCEDTSLDYAVRSVSL